MAKRRLKKKVRRTFLVIIFLIIGFAIWHLNPEDVDSPVSNTKKLQEDLEKKYNACLSKSYTSENYDEELLAKVIELDEYFKNYNVYISYSEIDDEYYYSYRDETTMYGASLIKLVDALYLVDNDVDLTQTVKLTSNFYKIASDGLKKEHKVGDDVTLETLVKYALSVSDNGAHQMLIRFIGFDNLKNYGRSLGAKHTLEGRDNFGNQTAYDTNIYLRKMYELSMHNENAKRMLEYMKNDYYGFLSVNNLDASHKYGYYGDVYHDIGIIYDSHPYAVSVLTKYGNKDFSEKVNLMSQKVNELHNQFWSSKESYCHKLVYEPTEEVNEKD